MFGNWMKKNQQDENKISILVTEREETRKVIRKLKNRMDETVQKAAEADELDRKICSADYSTMKDQLLAEMQHFEDLSRLISQLRSAGLTRRRAAALEQLTAVSDTVNRDQLIANADYVAARREMLAEEDEWYRDAMEEKTPSVFSTEDDEFTRLVVRAQAENAMKNKLPDLYGPEFVPMPARE